MNNLDVVVTEQNEACGGVVYWTLSGGVRVSALAAAFTANNLDPDLVPQPTAERALAKAMRSRADRNHIVRQLPDGTGWALVAESQQNEKTNFYTQSVRAFLESDGSIVIEPKGHPDAEVILDAFDNALTTLDGNDLSAILIATCKRLRAVSLRPMGGVYFVPSAQMPALEAIAAALEQVSASHVWRLPAMRSADAAKAILAAVAEEAETEVAKMEEELSSTLGARAIATREERTRALRAKVAEYEGLLGGSLDAVRDRLERTQAALAAAALAVAAENEAA